MSIALLQENIRARKTPLALVLGPEADKLPGSKDTARLHLWL